MLMLISNICVFVLRHKSSFSYKEKPDVCISNAVAEAVKVNTAFVCFNSQTVMMDIRSFYCLCDETLVCRSAPCQMSASGGGGEVLTSQR